MKKLILTKEIREKILHYHKQKFSPEMMVNKKQVKVGISTIYYWFHNGHLGLTKADMLYPRKGKVSRSKLVRTLSRQVNLSKNVLTLLIFAWKMVIMKLIPSY
ncbi:hypothetical protein PCS8203_00830 [Streptococcus pneumoniae PCS8203]|nr:hypothetical protein PCS8203_00830 [Streptococcus pneumoniae PCS8203]